VEDCAHADYRGAPGDGGAWTSGRCAERVFRGGGWAGAPGNLRAAERSFEAPDIRNSDLGFRLARSL
jgi:formylglycine-generating enzyme required for sulfatase activity